MKYLSPLLRKVLISLLVVTLLPSGLFAQEQADDKEEESPYQELVSTDGVKIEAEIMRIDNNEVTIRRKDRQVFTFPVSMLDSKSQRLLQAWALDKALAESLEIRVRERSLGREKNNTSYSTGDIKTVQMQFTATNKSATVIDDLRVEFRIFVTREQLGMSNKQFSREEIIPGQFSIRSLAANSQEVVDANPAIKLMEEKFHGNVYSTQSNKRSSQDKVSGYWYRVYRGKNLITENASPRRLMQVKDW